MHILSPETDNCPSWISRRERMTVENISWSISTKECCRPRRGSNLRPPGLQSDAHPTEPPRPAICAFIKSNKVFTLRIQAQAKSTDPKCCIWSESLPATQPAVFRYTSLSTLFKSYWDDGRVIMKDFGQWKTVQSWDEVRLQRDSNLGPHDSKSGVLTYWPSRKLPWRYINRQ